jgi:hypothetical protein
MTPRNALVTAALMACGALSSARAQNLLPLDFSQNVQAVNAIYPNNSTLGPEYYNGLSFDFRNVTTQGGQAVDARVSVIGTEGNYNFVGWIPDYNSDAGQPDGDLGVYYRHNGWFPPVDPQNPDAERFSTGGMAFTISFFVGDGTFTTSTVLSEVGFLIYDFDGEPGQSELIRTYLSDGFAGYQIRNGSGIDTHFQGDSQLFEAPGTNLSETGPEGSFIAYYQNTSQIRFDLFSTTSTNNPPGNNGIFASFDGDLGIVGGNLSGYGAFVAIPEPGTPLLAGTALAGLLLRRSRTRS